MWKGSIRELKPSVPPLTFRPIQAFEQIIHVCAFNIKFCYISVAH